MSKRRLVIRLLTLSVCINVAFPQPEKSTHTATLFTDIYTMTAEVKAQNEYVLPSSQMAFLLTTISLQSRQQQSPTILNTFKLFRSHSTELISSTKSSMYSTAPSSSLADIKTPSLTSNSTQAKNSIFSGYISIASTSIVRHTPSPTPRTPSLVLISSEDVYSNSLSFDLETMTRVSTTLHVYATPTSSSTLDSLSSTLIRGSDPTSNVNMTTRRGRMISTPGVVKTSVSYSTISTLIKLETVSLMPQTTLSTGDEEMEKTTIVNSRPAVPAPAYIGIVVVGILVLLATVFLILVLGHCFCRSKKYEYNTGNEYRITVQKWNTFSAHYTANQCDSVSSSRGSSISSLRSSNNNKMKPRYGGVSSSADRLNSGVHCEMYSTPL